MKQKIINEADTHSTTHKLNQNQKQRERKIVDFTICTLWNAFRDVMQTNSVIVIIMKSTYTVCIQSDVGKGKKTEMSSCVDG